MEKIKEMNLLKGAKPKHYTEDIADDLVKSVTAVKLKKIGRE